MLVFDFLIATLVESITHNRKLKGRELGRDPTTTFSHKQFWRNFFFYPMNRTFSFAYENHGPGLNDSLIGVDLGTEIPF